MEQRTARWVRVLCSVVGTAVGWLLLALGLLAIGHAAIGPVFLGEPLTLGSVRGVPVAGAGYLVLRAVVRRDGATGPGGVQGAADATPATSGTFWNEY